VIQQIFGNLKDKRKFLKYFENLQKFISKTLINLIFSKDVPCRRVRRWAFSLKELLKDGAGREQFIKFLEKEFSAENLK
jgi:hypothetical protein